MKTTVTQKKKRRPVKTAGIVLLSLLMTAVFTSAALTGYASYVANRVLSQDLAIQKAHIAALRLNPGTPVNEQDIADFDLVAVNPKINAVRTVSSHNSYRLEFPEPIYSVFYGVVPDATAFAYHYEKPSLTEQLNSGIRGLELDVNVEKNGIRVFHMYPFDTRTNGNDWLLCLEELKLWSDNNPDHFPLTICVEYKDTAAFLNPAHAKKSVETVKRLNDSFLQVFDKSDLIRPADIIGGYADMKEAIAADNWPRYNDAKGKILFYANVGYSADGIDREMIALDSAQQSLNFFISMRPNGDANQGSMGNYAAIAVTDDGNTAADSAIIKSYVEAGYLVRLTMNPYSVDKKGNVVFYEDRKNNVLASLGQMISTDYIECAISPKMPFVMTFAGKYLTLTK
ncbi:MAG: hypothetical protein LBT30_07995 [Clostridiales bacterium]|jgi:hypothetical protein|nr:hypothetical protein [Clostridiales bacterium]